MAASKNEVQITWPPAALSKSVAFGASQDSEVFALSADVIDASISIKADNDGIPAAGDKVKFYLLATSGDPDGAVADEYDSVNHGIFLGELDTASDDPAQATVGIPAAIKGGKIRAVNASAGRAITVSATISEIKSG